VSDSRSSEELSGVGAGLVGQAAAQHAGDFVDSFCFIEQGGLHPRQPTVGGFLYLDLLIGTDCNLGQVGNAQRLFAYGQAFE
jgi:hypothetical protein